MVFPKEPELITMEKLLTKRIDKLFDAMDNAIGDLFDDIIDEIEMLLKLAPPIYEELMIEKQVLIREMDGATKSISQISELARDEIYKQRFLVGETSSIEWDFRKDYMQSIINIMGKYQLIPFESPFIGEMTSVPTEAEIEEIEEIEETEELEPVEQLQPQPVEQLQPQPQPVEQLQPQPQPVEQLQPQPQSTVQKKEKKRKFEV